MTTAFAEMPDWMLHVSATAVDEDTREVWIGTLGDGLYRCNGGRCDHLDQLNSGLAGNVVFDVAIARSRVWAATNGGLSAFDPIMDQWNLHFARRTDGKPIAITKLQVVNRHVRAVAWHGASYCFQQENSAWGDCDDTKTASTKSAPRDPLRQDDCHSRSDNCSPSRGAIGVLLSANRTIALPGSFSKLPGAEHRPDLIAVELAVELRSNLSEDGPSLIVPTPGYASYGWGLPEDELVAYSRRNEIGGIVARLAGADAVTDAVLARLGLPTINMADAFEIRDEENPWVFRCLGDEPRRCARVLDYLFDELALKRLAAVRTPGRDAARHIDWWADHAEKRGVSFTQVVWNDNRDLGHVLTSLREARADAVLTWCEPDCAAKLLTGMRGAGMQEWFVGAPEIVSDEFVHRAGRQEAKVLAFVREPPEVDGPVARAFDAKFAVRSVEAHLPRRPDARAHRSLLATDHLAAAVAKAGADRECVRHELQRMEQTVFGERHCEDLIAHRTVKLARIVDGRWESLDLAAGLDKP